MLNQLRIYNFLDCNFQVWRELPSRFLGWALFLSIVVSVFHDVPLTFYMEAIQPVTVFIYEMYLVAINGWKDGSIN